MVAQIIKFIKKNWKKLSLGLLALLVIFFILRRTVFKPLPEYETNTARVQDLTQTLEVSGTVEADQKANLSFQTGGKLAWLGVKTGDQVQKYQAIASLDKSQLKKNLEKYLRDYQHQRWDFDQIRENNQVTSDNYDDYSFTNTIERLIEQEQFLLDKTVLDVEIQQITNKLATLVSPLAGVVTDMDYQVSEVNVKSTDNIVTIVDPKSLYFEVEIDEADIGSIYLSQSAQIVLEAFSNEVFDSQVFWIDFAASTSDSGGTVFLAKLSLDPNLIQKFRLGLTGDATIILMQKQNVLSVSLDALDESEDGKTIVKVLKDGKVTDVEVKTGLETDDHIEIISGLSEGDTVITGEKQKEK